MFKLGKDYGLEELKDLIYSLKREEEKKSRAWIWITAAIVLTLIGGIVFVWYKFLRDDEFYDEFDEFEEFDYDEYDDEEYDEENDDRDYGIVYDEEEVVVEEPEDISEDTTETEK